jgi:hypothetical protein
VLFQAENVRLGSFVKYRSVHGISASRGPAAKGDERAYIELSCNALDAQSGRNAKNATFFCVLIRETGETAVFPC